MGILMSILIDYDFVVILNLYMVSKFMNVIT